MAGTENNFHPSELRGVDPEATRGGRSSPGQVLYDGESRGQGRLALKTGLLEALAFLLMKVVLREGKCCHEAF